MSTDDFVKINVTDSEIGVFSEPEQTTSLTLQFQYVQQEILSPALHQIQPSLIAANSTLTDNSKISKSRKFGRLVNPTV